MNTTVVFSLDYRTPKKDGTCALLLRIIHHGKPAQITTGIYLHEKDWDDKKRLIKSSYKGTESITRLNNYLQKQKAEALDIITKLADNKTLDSFSVYDLKDLIKKKSDKVSFIKYTEKLIEQLKEVNRIGNARAYKSALDALKSFNKDKDVSFQEINLRFLEKFESSHLAKGNSYNSISAYLRATRAIYNKAIKDGIIERELYPFDKFTIKSTKTRKRAIGLDAISKIEALKFKSTELAFHARNYFLFSFYTRGMPFADMAELKLSNLIDGRIFYQRKKTDKPYNIKITAEIKRILDFYVKDKEKDEYIFNIIKRESITDQYKDVEWARKRYNKKLKYIAELCGIQENLTSYVSRHSFATRAKNLQIPIADISDMLGHESIKTTEVYLDSLPSDILDEYHKKVINLKLKIVNSKYKIQKGTN
ncbi:MAG: site-specific integrase [Chitinophagales bacterium]